MRIHPLEKPIGAGARKGPGFRGAVDSVDSAGINQGEREKSSLGTGHDMVAMKKWGVSVFFHVDPFCCSVLSFEDAKIELDIISVGSDYFNFHIYAIS